jgi:hypothetical protein
MFLCHWTYGADVFLVGFFRKREYNITDNNLEGKYKDWQKKLHPDLVHSKSEVSVHLTFIELSIFNVSISKSLLNGLYLLFRKRGAMLRSSQHLWSMHTAHSANLYQGHCTWWVCPAMLKVSAMCNNETCMPRFILF